MVVGGVFLEFTDIALVPEVLSAGLFLRCGYNERR
jgi:hypothetical protein